MCSKQCMTPVEHTEDDMCISALESAAIPHEVHHQVPGEIQAFPYFWFCAY